MQRLAEEVNNCTVFICQVRQQGDIGNIPPLALVTAQN